MHRISDKLYSWASIIEGNTLAQADLTSRMPFIHRHVALMPDAHLGKGSTVGSVIPTIGAIMPAAVGVDIGCGMLAVRTQLHTVELMGKSLTPLREAIERAVPLSAGRYNTELLPSTADKIETLVDYAESHDMDSRSYSSNWEFQLGTLGSGNHFIEVSGDETGAVWLFLHSGSRGVGNRIATHHIKVARALMTRWFIELPDPDLAYLVEGTDEFVRYIRAMWWAQEFARLNREEMMDRVVRCLEEFTDETVDRLETIGCHHNYTVRERHFGEEVWLTRKGAIDASAGRLGLIPGSMGTRSYVVRGLGNPKSFDSAPHGAGRVHSRTSAKKTFTSEQLEVAMRGIEWRKTDKFLDEIPAAYKDIDQVMTDASDLVGVVHTLGQLVNVKGD